MDPLMHVLIPSLILIAMGWKRGIIKWSFFAILPDVLYFTEFHRNLSHSIIVLGIISAAILYFMKNKRLAAALVFFLISHSVLDIGGYVAIFYPVTDSYFRLHSDIILRNPQHVLDFDTWLEVIPPGQLTMVYDSYPLQTITVLFWLLFLSALILAERQKIIKGVKGLLRQ